MKLVRMSCLSSIVERRPFSFPTENKGGVLQRAIFSVTRKTNSNKAKNEQ